MPDPTDETVDAQPIASISSLRSRFENLQANVTHSTARSKSPAPLPLQSRVDNTPPIKDVIENSTSAQLPRDDETKPLSASSSGGISASKGPPPPRPTSKKPIPPLRNRRRSSEDVFSHSGSEPSWKVGMTYQTSAPPPAITVRDKDATPPAVSGVAALRALFHGSNETSGIAPPVRLKSPGTSTLDAKLGTITSPAPPSGRTLSPYASRNTSPDHDQPKIEQSDLESVQNEIPTIHLEPRSGSATPLRSLADSEQSGSTGKSINGFARANVSLTVGEDATRTGKESLPEEQTTRINIPTLPSRSSKPAVPPRLGASSVPPHPRTSADSSISEASLTTSSDSPVSSWTEEPEDTSVAHTNDAKGPPPIPLHRPNLSTSLPQVKALTLPPRLPARLKVVGPATEGPLERLIPDLPSRPPVRKDVTAKSSSPPRPSRTRAVTVSSSTSDGSVSMMAHLPPPSRHTTPQASRISSRRVSLEEDFSSDDDVESDDDEVPASFSSSMPATSALKRALDEYPDVSRASRRPPDFNPRQLVSSTHTIHCFAVSGHRLCIGCHNVKVYDLTLGDSKPVITVELRNTNLDFRGKDARVTAMAFRSVVDNEKEGRFLWCGTSHGHVWELDTATGGVTDTKTGLHGAAVTYIFRYKERMLTLDETGKLHVFGPISSTPAFGTPDDPRRFVPWRTIRTSDKINFAGMLGHQLWTSSGPTTRSTTNSSLRGPTIRIFEPMSEASSVGKTVFTTEWTGAVTSAAVIPFSPDVVYLGHEGGFISIFSRKDLACLKVLKISPSDILALEGVGDRLWVGARSGMISVYNVQSLPWVATNTWLAHPDHAVTRLHVDPTSIAESGRYTIWSWARDALHAWDGLLSKDWIESSLTEREREYCSFRDIRALICSWNIGSCKPEELSGVPENANFLMECLKSVDSPDIIVFGFQEVIDLDNKKLTAKTVLFGGKNRLDGSKSSGDKVSHAYRHWFEKLVSAVRLAMPPLCPYVVVSSENLVGLLSIVFVKSEMKASVKDIALATVKRGLNGIYGNKGAIVARLVVDDSSVCFINVHLAAGQTQKAARNADLAAILEDKAVFPASVDSMAFVGGGDGSAILDHEDVFLSGDLNYRIDQRRDNVISNVNVENLPYLLEHDQLLKETRTNSSFRLRNFTEPPITFAPTYKYKPYSNEYDMSAKMRIPAWCDRILYRSRDATRVECLNYKRYEANVSDHRPISASFRVTVKSVDPDRYRVVVRAVEEEWEKEESDKLARLSEVLSTV